MKTVCDDMNPYLRSVILQDVHPFGSEVAFRFDPRVNVLIGPNGAGKSAALDRFAGQGRRRLSPSTDDSKASVEWVMEPERVSFRDVTTVYVGPTRAPLTPEMVLSDLQMLDVQGRVTALLGWTRWGFGAALALVLTYLTVGMVGNIFFDQEARWFEFGMRDLIIIYVFFFLAFLLYLLASILRRRPHLLISLSGSELLSNALTYRSQVSPIFMFQAVSAANRRWLGSVACSVVVGCWIGSIAGSIGVGVVVAVPTITVPCCQR